MKLWDTPSRDRLVMFGLGVLGGLSVLLIPKPKPLERVETVVLEKVRVEKQEVVRYQDRWRDRTVTVDKPSGERIVIVEKSGETIKEQEKVEVKEVVEVEKVVTESKPLTKYALGIVYFPLGEFGVDVSARLGDLPLFVGATVGKVSTTGEFTPALMLNLRWEF